MFDSETGSNTNSTFVSGPKFCGKEGRKIFFFIEIVLLLNLERECKSGRKVEKTIE